MAFLQTFSTQRSLRRMVMKLHQQGEKGKGAQAIGKNVEDVGKERKRQRRAFVREKQIAAQEPKVSKEEIHQMYFKGIKALKI